MAKRKTRKKARFKRGSPKAKEYMAKIRTKKKMGTVIIAPSPMVTGSNTKFETPQEIEKRLTKELRRGMPTKSEMSTTPPGTIHKHLDWENRNRDNIARWKDIRRELYPDDPNAANLENIREE